MVFLELELRSGGSPVSGCACLCLLPGPLSPAPHAEWCRLLFRDGSCAAAVSRDVEICARRFPLPLTADLLRLLELTTEEGSSVFAPLISSGTLFSANSWRGAAVDTLEAQGLVGIELGRELLPVSSR